MADILNRLLLDTKNFDANLNSSKKSVNDYQGGVTNMAKTAGAGVLKLAGAFGLAMGASEAFNKVLNSSQALGDMTARNTAALKGSVDEFFYALGSGDFSSFLGGLGDIIDKAKEAHGAIDQLGNTKISHSYFSAENSSKVADAQYTAKNKFAPFEERTQAFGNWRSALSSQQEINQTLQGDLVKAITTSVESEIGGGKLKVTMDDVKAALKIDVTDPQKRDELKQRYSNGYNAYVAYDAAKRKELNNTTDPKRIEAINQQIKGNIESQREAIIVNAMLNKYKDEELANIASMASEYQNLTSALRSMSREYNETAMEFNNSNKSANGFTPVQSLEGYKVYNGNANNGVNTKSTPTPPLPVGSIAAIDAELSKLNKELISATTLQARIAVQTTINELEAKKISLKIEADAGMFAAKHGKNKLSDASGDKMAGVLNGSKGFDFKNIKQLKSPITKKDVNTLEDYQNNLHGVADAMGFMAGAVEGSAASWLNWGASLLNSIAQAIPAIRSLIPALAAKTAGEAASSAAQVPLVGWLAAGGAALSMISLFASLPKFANGGIIEGGSAFGDMNLARVNAGEMILNRGQQSRLFSIINSGEIVGSTQIVNTIASTSIRGKDLILVINNELKSKGKKTLW